MSKATILMVGHTLVVSLVVTVLTTGALGQTSQRPVLSFTSLANPNSETIYQRRAVVFVFDRGVWQLVYLPENYEDVGWEYAGRSKNTRQVWAIAQFARAGYGPDLEIAYSIDDGRSWRHFHSLRKVSRFALFHDFSMDKNGKGSLTIRLQDSPEDKFKDGFYTYTTVDAGRSWTNRPRYSATAPPSMQNNSLEQIRVETNIPCSEPSSD